MRVHVAWRTPVPDLTGAQIRVLTGQKFGLEWLARPVLAVLMEYPDAECDLYEGDLAWNALHAVDELAKFAPAEVKAWLGSDLDWMEIEFAYDAEVLGDVEEMLDSARRRFL